MVKCFLIVLLAGFALSGIATAGPPAPQRTDRAQPRKSVVIPGTAYEIAFGKSASALPGEPPSPALLKAIATWLASNFRLPRDAPVPRVTFASPVQIATFRYTGILSDRPDDVAAVPPGQREVVAVYDPVVSTIYLPQGWTGSTPAELSTLVHEMVHHLQHKAGMRYECGQASEELAYAAQDAWLRMFGRDLAGDFEIDPFTLLVSLRCIY